MTNDAAERLRALFATPITDDAWEGADDLLDAALAAERKATVERMVERFGMPGTCDTLDDVLATLDAEAR